MQPRAGRKPYRGRLRVDPTFFLELQYCDSHGLPHSTFLDWTPEDRAKALAFTMEKNTRCVMCGTAQWEWDSTQGGTRFAYEPVEKYCHGCYVKTVMSEESGRNPGITIELSPTGTQESARRHVKAREAWLKKNVKDER